MIVSVIVELEKTILRNQLQTISVEKYHRLFELGIIPEKTELIEGVIFKKMPKSAEHTYATEIILDLIKSIFPDCYVRKEDPLTTENSEPEPDIAVIEEKREAFSRSHPTSARLVIEVSKSTYQTDQDKQFVYAHAKVSEYWIVNLEKGETEVFRTPINDQYKEKTIYRSDEEITINGRSISLQLAFKL